MDKFKKDREGRTERMIRTQRNLNGIWDFRYFGEKEPDFPIFYDDFMSVPGCFDLMEPYCGERGFSALHRVVDAEGFVKLTIDGMGLNGKVYWDGILIGEAKFPYMTEAYYFDAGKNGKHDLTIVLENHHNYMFQPDFDFYGYGGIYGNVTLENCCTNPIVEVLVSTENYRNGEIRVRASTLRKKTQSATLIFAGQKLMTAEFADGTLDCRLALPEFRLWSPENPNLHSLVLRTEDDEVEEEFGVRLFETSGRQILLNGNPIKLLGFNRHESFPLTGAAMPLQLMASDLKLLKSNGYNFVRGSHYPQRREFLKLCDRMGILVWEETLGWDIQPPKLHETEFLKVQKEEANRLTRISFNHPCIIIRGFLNENDSRKRETRAVIKGLYDEIRSVDEHCLISFSSNKYEEDVCTDLVDVVAMNPYPGWYDSDYKSISTIHLIHPRLKMLSDALPKDKPFLITELGADAEYGFRDPLKTRWSEEYQSQLLASACRYVLDNDDCAGIAFWLFADTRSYVNGPEIYGRCRGFNTKGILDEYRRPKLAWYTLNELIRGRRK